MDAAAHPSARVLPLGGLTLEELERQAIVQALAQSGGNQVHAAKLLGISRDTMRYRMKRYGLLDVEGGD